MDRFGSGAFGRRRNSPPCLSRSARRTSTSWSARASSNNSSSAWVAGSVAGVLARHRWIRRTRGERPRRASISRSRPRNWPPSPPPSRPGGDRAGRSSSSRVAGITLAEFLDLGGCLQLRVGNARDTDIGLGRVVGVRGGGGVEAGQGVEEGRLATVGETDDSEPCHPLIVATNPLCSDDG